VQDIDRHEIRGDRELGSDFDRASCRLSWSSLSLHPIVLLMSPVIGGVVADMVGLILAAPLTSIGINLFKDLKASGLLRDDEVESTQPHGDPAT